MSGRLILLLLTLLSCERSPSVHVTGAVLNPGSYPVAGSDTFNSLLETAGGPTSEADTARAFVFREVPDSNDLRVGLHIPWKQAERLKPGDTLHIPSLTYGISFGSLLQVQNVDLTQGDRRYRLERGYLLQGFVKNKPEIAIIIGRGLVESAGENAHSGTFHYLYARMDHTEFDTRMRPFITGPSNDSDVREDALTIHSKLFQKAGHTANNRALKPPDGYFKIFAGAYPAPRTQSHPGAGMRQRTYDDGRIWTTFGDGRQRTRYPDGKIVRLMIDGSERTEHTDGRIETVTTFGTRITEYADGRKRMDYPNGTVVEQHNGLKVTTYSTGTVSTVHPDGRRVNRFTSGVTETAHPGGLLHIITEKGDTIIRKSDGTETFRTKTGEEVITFPDGRRLQSSVRAPLIALDSEGGRRVRTYTGEKMTVMPDGERRITYADGVRRTIYPDGRDIIEGRNGITTLYLEDGSQRKTYRPGVSEERPPRLSMVQVNDLPESIEPGERIGMSLTFGPMVQRIEIGAFPLPRGRVLNIEPAFIDSHYATAHCVLSDPGLYRLQILANTGNDAFQIAYDRIIRVGNGETDSLVVTIRPTQSTETIATQLFSRINAERSSLGIGDLKPAASIDQIVRERLWDIIDAQAMPGMSFLAGSAHEKMTLAAEGFNEVREYSARADLPEDAHIRLMLRDMRYRKAVLDTNWTHVGIAAEKSGGEYLFGIIFKK